MEYNDVPSLRVQGMYPDCIFSIHSKFFAKTLLAKPLVLSDQNHYFEKPIGNFYKYLFVQ